MALPNKRPEEVVVTPPSARLLEKGARSRRRLISATMISDLAVPWRLEEWARWALPAATADALEA